MNETDTLNPLTKTQVEGLWKSIRLAGERRAAENIKNGKESRAFLRKEIARIKRLPGRMFRPFSKI